LKLKLKTVWDYFYGFKGLLLIFYCAFVFITDAFVSHERGKYFIRSAFIISLACFLLCPLLLKFTKKISFEQKDFGLTKNKKLIQLMFYAIPFLFFAMLYVIYYPGGFSADSINQYKQAINNSYDDWHPVFQTLFAIKLPLLLTGGWIGSIVLFQIVLLSAVLGYAFGHLFEYAGLKYSIISMVFILGNTEIWNLAIHPWKDTSFAMGALLLVVFAMNIHFSEGEWIKKPLNTIAFIVVIVLTTLFRHNAILFTAPMLIPLFMYISKKRFIAIVLSFIVLFLGVKYPLYSAMQVEQPGSRQVETLGLPLTIIGAVVSQDPESLDEEVLTFAYEVAPKELWEEKFDIGSYNSIKWHEQTNNEVVEQYGTAKVLKMLVKCVKASPKVAITSFIRLTGPMYTLTEEYLIFDVVEVVDNDLGLKLSGIRPLQTQVDKLIQLIPLMLPHIFMYLGVMHLILIIAVLAKCNFKKADGWRKAMTVAPVFAYNFGTALLLTGYLDVGRFFCYTVLLFPFLLPSLFIRSKQDDEVKIK